MPEPTATPAKRGFPFRRLCMDTPYALVFSLLCAVVITAVTGKIHTFWQNLVISMCIGTTAFVLIDGARLALWGESGAHRKNHWVGFFVITLVAVPVAQHFGSLLAGSLLGIELQGLRSIFTNGQVNSMLVFTLLATGGGALFFASRERLLSAEAAVAKERANVEALARQALQAQLQLLQAQIEPHMLFNTLANLQGLIALDPERAQRMLDQLIQYLRATLVSSRAERTTLAQEFALMDAYLGLMSVRMGQRLSYRLDLPDALRGAIVPPMLLQPLVENAIIHGLEPTIDGGHVTVGAVRRGAVLELSVADTGRGLDAPSAKSGSHIGVTNTGDRLRAMFGERAALSLEPGAPRGAVARLTLPLETP